MKITLNNETHGVDITLNYTGVQGGWRWRGKYNGIDVVLDYPYDYLYPDTSHVGKRQKFAVKNSEQIKAMMNAEIQKEYESNPVRVTFSGSYNTFSGVFGGAKCAMLMSYFAPKGTSEKDVAENIFDWAKAAPREGVKVEEGKQYKIEDIFFDTFSRFMQVVNDLAPKPKHQPAEIGTGVKIEYHGTHETWDGIEMF